MLNARYEMHAEVRLPDGTPARIIGIYFHGSSTQPQYLTERKDAAGVLYQLWFAEDDLKNP